MLTATLLALLAHLGAPALAVIQNPDDGIPPLVPANARGVLIDGAVVGFDKVPAAVGKAAVAAIEQVRPWCESAGKIAALDGKGRFVLVVDPKDKRALRRYEAALETANWFDARLPAPTQADAAKEEDLACAIVHIVRDEGEQGLLLDLIVAKQTSLKDWSKAARKKPGFVLYEPLLIAVLLKPKSAVRWNAEHDMANRLAQLLVERRFGAQPDWLSLGVGWCAEWRMDAEIHCFPNRMDPVQRAEHGAWGNEIRRECAKRMKLSGVPEADGDKREVAPILALELSACRRGKWNGDGSRRAFGVASWLLDQKPDLVADLLHDLRRARETLARATTPPVPDDLELPPEEIEKVLATKFGASWLVDASKWIAEGRIPQSMSVAK
jgi:hypothetical protein